MSAKEMIAGVKIEFDKENIYHFENTYSIEIDPDILVISLLETINDICKRNNLNTVDKLKKYIKMGSVDNYIGDYEKDFMEKLKTYEEETKGE